MQPTLETPVRHRFVLELLGARGVRIHDVPLERADFHRAIESAFFTALRRGLFTDYTPPLDSARIEPCMRSSAPASAGFEVILDTPAGEHRERFGLEFFKTLVRRTAAPLVLAGKITADTELSYRLTAFADEQQPRKRGGLVIELDTEPATIPLRDGALTDQGVTLAWDAPSAEDFPVLIPRHVIDEAVSEARQMPDREVGGVLLGHLRRDPDSREVHLEVTCLVPCESTEATETSVTFTHQTWARVREVTDLRGEGELIVGWVHSHPFRLCAECPKPVPAECQAKVLFYSADDEFLMELTFPRPFMVGLLAAVEPRLEEALGHPPVKLYGWRNGQIRPRGFEVL